MIKHNGTILKPITKPKCGQREVGFYEEVNRATDEARAELREFIPKYFGTVKVPLRGRDVECIVLEDLTKHYKEPCVMDIKIGRRTWDPTANYEKIVNEEVRWNFTEFYSLICNFLSIYYLKEKQNCFVRYRTVILQCHYNIVTMQYIITMSFYSFNDYLLLFRTNNCCKIIFTKYVVVILHLLEKNHIETVIV